MKIGTSNMRFALRWVCGHLVVCVLVATIAALLVFLIWYPAPWRQMLGVESIFLMLMGIDIVCGPLLTFILASSQKPKRTLVLDLSVVAMIQVAALGYGMWSVFVARPVVVAFEVDRFVVVSANEVASKELDEAPLSLRHLSWIGPRYVATRSSLTADEQLKSIELSMNGVTTAMRPGWWILYEEAASDVNRAAKPLMGLLEKRVGQDDVLKRAAERSGFRVTELFYVPLTSSQKMDWVMLLDSAGRVVGHAHVDGFE